MLSVKRKKKCIFFEKDESATQCGEMGERSSKWKELVV